MVINHLFTPTLPMLLFILVVLFLYGFLTRYCLKASKKSNIWTLIISVWLILMGVLSAIGFFSKFDGIPPRFALAILPWVIAMIAISASKHTIQMVKPLSTQLLVYVQSFRIIIECIFWMLASQRIIPEIMTWSGKNTDIFIGLSAPIIAYLCFSKKILPTSICIAWNILGIASLTKTVATGILSAPTQFQLFVTEPANTFIAALPYIWLPSFVVPCAILFHILSIKKLMAEKPE